MKILVTLILLMVGLSSKAITLDNEPTPLIHLDPPTTNYNFYPWNQCAGIIGAQGIFTNGGGLFGSGPAAVWPVGPHAFVRSLHISDWRLSPSQMWDSILFQGVTNWIQNTYILGSDFVLHTVTNTLPMWHDVFRLDTYAETNIVCFPPPFESFCQTNVAQKVLTNYEFIAVMPGPYGNIPCSATLVVPGQVSAWGYATNLVFPTGNLMSIFMSEINWSSFGTDWTNSGYFPTESSLYGGSIVVNFKLTWDLYPSIIPPSNFGARTGDSGAGLFARSTVPGSPWKFVGTLHGGGYCAGSQSEFGMLDRALGWYTNYWDIRGQSTNYAIYQAIKTNIAYTYQYTNCPYINPTTTNYPLTVVSGTGSGSYTNGTVVSISASSPPVGYTFLNWTGSSLVASSNSASTTITMPSSPVSVTANYVVTNATYTATITGGTGSGSYTNGAVVSIVANSPPSGQVFGSWTGYTVASQTSASTSFVMPASAVSLIATYVTAPTTNVNVVKQLVKAYDDMDKLLSDTPAKSMYFAAIKGVATKYATDGFVLWYSPTATDATNTTTVFMPYSGVGRWFRINGLGGAGGSVNIGLVMPTGLPVANSPLTTSGDLIVTNSMNEIVVANTNGGFRNAVRGIDYVYPGEITNSGLTMGSTNLLGRTTAGLGALESIAAGYAISLFNRSITSTVYLDVKLYTNAGTYTWTNPPGGIMSYVMCIGGGEGGASGSRNKVSDPQVKTSGKGGQGGGTSIGLLVSSNLTSTVSVIVGAGGAGAAASSGTNTPSVNGTAGLESVFGNDFRTNYVIAWGGGPAFDCLTNVVGCYQGGGRGTRQGGFGGPAWSNAMSPVPDGYANAISWQGGTSGGGSGGIGGASGGNSYPPAHTTLGVALGGPVDSNGAAGARGSYFVPGGGGGGGGGVSATMGGDGGHGGWPGGGGGGGGISSDAFGASGAGGNGGDGFVGVVTICIQ